MKRTLLLFLVIIGIPLGIFGSVCGGILWELGDKEAFFIMIGGIITLIGSIFIHLILLNSQEHRSLYTVGKIFIRSIFIMAFIFLCVFGLGAILLSSSNIDKEETLVFIALFISCIGIIKILK